MDIITSIDDINLHDSVLLEVRIQMDTVVFRLDYITDYESMASERRDMVFHECKYFRMNINPGFNPPDSILIGNEYASGGEKKYVIEMNTTATIIEIVARKLSFGK